MISKFVNQIRERYRIKRKRNRLIEKTRSECFKLRYTMLNLCMQYTHQGLKEGRFLYRIKKASRQLSRREIHLNKLRKL